MVQVLLNSARGLRTKRVRVVLEQGDDVREVTFDVGIDVDVQGYVDANFDALWSQGEATVRAERGGIVQFAKVARNYYRDIRLLSEAVMTADMQGMSLTNRYDLIAGVIAQDVSAGFRNRFNAALETERGVDLSVGLLSLTVSGQRAYVRMARAWSVQYFSLALASETLFAD